MTDPAPPPLTPEQTEQAAALAIGLAALALKKGGARFVLVGFDNAEASVRPVGKRITVALPENTFIITTTS